MLLSEQSRCLSLIQTKYMNIVTKKKLLTKTISLPKLLKSSPWMTTIAHCHTCGKCNYLKVLPVKIPSCRAFFAFSNDSLCILSLFISIHVLSIILFIYPFIYLSLSLSTCVLTHRSAMNRRKTSTPTYYRIPITWHHKGEVIEWFSEWGIGWLIEMLRI